MPNELNISASYEVIQRYECTNRITRAKLRMTKILFTMGNKPSGVRVYLSCNTHSTTIDCKNKSEAVNQMRRPWVWCDGCAEIHYNTEWKEQQEAQQ